MLNITQYIPRWASPSQSVEQDKTPLTPPASADGDQSEGRKSEDGVLPGTSASRENRESQNEQAFMAERMEYDKRVKGIIDREYPQLCDATYLDNAAAPPSPSSLLTAHIQDLMSNLYSNPHSRSPSSAVTSLAIERIRNLVLQQMFGVGAGGWPGTSREVAAKGGGVGCRDSDEGWDLIWTSGATAGLKLVGECFDWSGSDASGMEEECLDDDHKGEFCHLQEAHTSLVGIRDLAIRAGATVKSLTLEDLIFLGSGDQTPGRRLVGMPLQCNSTGRKYLSDIARIRGLNNGGESYLLVDAAGFMSGHQARYDLSQVPYAEAPDFIAFSFYKIFGYPTGLGGLVVKRSAAHTLSRKAYFGGGTLDAYTSRGNWKAPRGERNGVLESLGARFEDGTVNYQAILAIPHGLRILDELFGPWEMRQRHVDWLAARLLSRCTRMRHGNGKPVVKIYSGALSVAALLQGGLGHEEAMDLGDQGATLNFNILTASGDIVPPTEVDRLACVQNIHLREGRHCNAGVITSQLGVAEEEIVDQYRQGYGCDDVGLGDGNRVSSSLRASLGISNTSRDVNTFTAFLEKFFVDRQMETGPSTSSSAEKEAVIGTYTLSQMVVYPIKSCAGQYISLDTDWPLTEHGLEHDREWVVVSLTNGKMLSQKRHPRMALIRPQIELDHRILSIKFGPYSHEVDTSTSLVDLSSRTMEICGEDSQPTVLREPGLQADLSAFLGIPCALAQQVGYRHSKLGQNGGGRVPLLLSNESPFLLINERSVDAVSEWIPADATNRLAKVSSFRANFTIAQAGGKHEEPFLEDDFTHAQIGEHVFVALGRCRRCQMVAIDQETGEKTPEMFIALAQHRRSDRGKIHFGQHLGWMPPPSNSGPTTIRAGAAVILTRYS